jgi:hypothetical protein
MSDPISAVTTATDLADADLFALAKATGTGPTGFASRHISAANLLSEVANNTTFVTELAANTTFITELTSNAEFVTETVNNTVAELIDDSTFITNQQTVLRTVVEEEAGATYTLVLADASHKWKRFTSASAVTLTIPAEASVAWPDNTYIELEQAGNGDVTVEAGVGVTLNYNENLTPTLYGNYAVAGLKKTGTNTWNLFGNLVPA